MPDKETPEYLRLIADEGSASDDPQRLRRRGGDGDGSGIEPRVARLEASVAYIQRDIAELKTDVREFRTDLRDVRERVVRLEERVAHLPTKGFVVTSVVVTLAVLTAVITFQDRIQEFVRQVPAPSAQMLPNG